MLFKIILFWAIGYTITLALDEYFDGDQPEDIKVNARIHYILKWPFVLIPFTIMLIRLALINASISIKNWLNNKK